MGLRDRVFRSAQALLGEVVDRVDRALDRRGRQWPPAARPSPSAPRREPARPEPPRATHAVATARTEAAPAPAPAPPKAAPAPAPAPPKAAPAPVTRAERPQAPEPSAAPPRASAPPDEPILTRTMAGVLSAQGFHERALRIYDHLLARDPGDGDLASEADEVRARMHEGEERPADEVAAVPVRRDSLLVSWKVTERSVERARAVLGGDGTLTARLVVVARERGADVRADCVEQAPVDATGEHVFTPIPTGARCTASVGLRSGDRFVSVAHSRVVPT